ALDRRQHAAFQVSIARAANLPLVLQASGDVAVRQREVIGCVLRPAAFGVADPDVIFEEALASGREHGHFLTRISSRWSAIARSIGRRASTRSSPAATVTSQ